MNFYELWAEFNAENINDDSFIEAFLQKKSISEKVLLTGSDDEMFQLCAFLNKYNINHLINKISSRDLTKIESYMVIQFSNFYVGVDKLIKKISKKNEPMTYDQIGLELLGERDSIALKKYGENHAKLANMFSLVNLTETKPILVGLTSFGKFNIMLDYRYKQKILRILALREPLIKNMIYRAKQGKCIYNAEVSCLSDSTKIRRKSNVKSLLEFILVNTEFEYLLGNIVW